MSTVSLVQEDANVTIYREATSLFSHPSYSSEHEKEAQAVQVKRTTKDDLHGHDVENDPSLHRGPHDAQHAALDQDVTLFPQVVASSAVDSAATVPREDPDTVQPYPEDPAAAGNVYHPRTGHDQDETMAVQSNRPAQMTRPLSRTESIFAKLTVIKVRYPSIY